MNATSSLPHAMTMAIAIGAFALNVHARNPESENTMNRDQHSPTVTLASTRILT